MIPLTHHNFRSNAQPSTQILIGMYLWGSHPRPGEEEEKMVVAEKKRTGAIFAPNLQWTPCGEFYGEISATMHEMPPFPIVSAITDYLRRTIPPTIPISGLLCLLPTHYL